MPLNKDPKPITLLLADKFVELNIISANDEITIYLDTIATNNEILEWIEEAVSNDLQYKDRQILVPEDNNMYSTPTNDRCNSKYQGSMY